MIFWIFFLIILSLIVEVYLWWKLQASLIFLSGRTCTIGGWLNTFLPHCKMYWGLWIKREKKCAIVIRDKILIIWLLYKKNYVSYGLFMDNKCREHIFSAFNPSKYTHTWSSGHCSLRKCSSTATACNFIQDLLVWNTLNYINIYYRTIISPINTSLSKCIIYYLRKRSQFEYISV